MSVVPDGELTSIQAIVLRCAHVFGRKASRHTKTRLAHDVLLLVHGIRDVLLWDYTGVNTDSDQLEIDTFAPCIFLSRLWDEYPPSRGLTLVHIGPSLFLAAVDKVLRSRTIPGAIEGPTLIAVDRHLPAPRRCSAAEVHEVNSVLSGIIDDLVRLRASKVSPQPLLQLPVPTPASSMVAVHGWLLGYPIVYCFVAGGASTEASCLCGYPLSVVRVEAVPASKGFAARKHAMAAAPHLVCSFSLPTASGSCAGNEALGRDTELIHHWIQVMMQRFQAQTYWQMVDVSVESCVHEHIVL